MTFPSVARSLGAVLVAAVLAVLPAVPSAARVYQPHPWPRPMVPANQNAFRLTWTDNQRGRAADLAYDVNPGHARIGLGRLLDSARRVAVEGCHTATHGGVLTTVATVDWYCLNHRDSSTGNWTPQGVSGTRDAYRGGTMNGRRAYVFSWHRGSETNPGGTGTRLSFLDPLTSRYVHVLLVRPIPGPTRYTDVSTHAGGIVWYGHYLFVANVRRGVYVYDLHNLLRLENNPRGDITHPGRIGLHGGVFYGHGYRYLLPEIGRWTNVRPVTTRYDYIGLERFADPTRTPVAVTGEYCDGVQCRRGRVVRWRMTRLMSFRNTPPSFHGSISPFRAWLQPDPYTQGGVSTHGCYYFDIGGSHSHNHYLIISRPAGPAGTYRNGGSGLQDLYWERVPDRLWTITEHQGYGVRVLYAVNRPHCA